MKRVLILFSTVMIASMGVSWTVQMLSQINFITTGGQKFLTALHFSFLLLPSVIPLVIPFALMIAIISILSTMNQDSELAIISAAGLPKSTLWKPILLLAFLASLASFSIANFVAPQAQISMRNLLANSHYNLVSLLIREGKFQKLTNNLYVGIGQQNSDGTLGRLFIADQRDPQIDVFYHATKGSIISNENGHFLALHNGEIERINYQNDSVSIVKFSSYTLSVSEFMSHDGTQTIYPKDRPFSYLLHPDPNDPYYKQKPIQYRAELHRRLTEWLLPIVFALIAIAAAGNVHPNRQARISATFSTITSSLLIYWIMYFFAEKTKNNLAYAPLLYIIPIGVCIFIFCMLLIHRKINLSEKLINNIQILFQKTINKFKRKNSQYSSDEIS